MVDGRGVLYTINSWSRGAILAFLAGTDLGALPRHAWERDPVGHMFPPLTRRARRRRGEPDDDIDWQRFG